MVRASVFVSLTYLTPESHAQRVTFDGYPMYLQLELHHARRRLLVHDEAISFSRKFPRNLARDEESMKSALQHNGSRDCFIFLLA